MFFFVFHEMQSKKSTSKGKIRERQKNKSNRKRKTNSMWLRSILPKCAGSVNCSRADRVTSNTFSYLRQGSRALAWPDFLSIRRVFVSYSQPIRFARFDGKSVNRGLPLLDQPRALDPCRRPEGPWALGTRTLPTYIGRTSGFFKC